MRIKGLVSWYGMCLESMHVSESRHLFKGVSLLSSPDVAELSGHLYCVGGSEGQRTLKSCEVYNMEENKWTFIAPLNIGKTLVTHSSLY